MNDNDDGNASTRALRQVQDTSEVLDHARTRGTDAAPAVRRAVAVFLRDVPLANSKDLMVDLTRYYHAGDRFALDMRIKSCRGPAHMLIRRPEKFLSTSSRTPMRDLFDRGSVNLLKDPESSSG